MLAAPPSVRSVPNIWIPLPDGTRLAARAWIPADATERPVPVILDAVPYRKGDGTAAWDHGVYAHLAEAGYACVRLDLRGSGDSDGLIADEYSAQEQDDVVDAIAWLAEQPFCDGTAGMIGVSWGGFSSLQIAARTPPALRGIVPIHCSDDRYADDVHYRGGCVLATDMLQWSASMAAYINQPPDPAVVGDGWRAAWLERLDAFEPWIAHWLGHQRRDDYWRHASVCEDYSAIECPVFAVGGWMDGYRDFVLRLLEQLDVPVRGLIGPWGHTWPEEGAPGPAIGFVAEVVRFFDAALKGEENGFFDEPALVSWMQEPVAPRAYYAERPGRWVAEPAWPSPHVATRTFDVPMRGSVRGLQATGSEAGVWCGDGGPSDAPGDQRPDDGASLCWDSEPLADRVELLGHVAATLQLEADQPLALVAVRLCDVAPDGASTLVARGVLNLARRDGHDRTVPLTPGERFAVRVPLQSTAYAIPAGHALRLAVSPTYWPWAWPSPVPVKLTVHGGTLELPVRDAGAPDAPPFGPPAPRPGLELETLTAGAGGRTMSRDLATGAVETTFDWRGGTQRTRLTQPGIEMAERNVARYRIVEGDPLSAEATSEVEVGLARGDLRTRIAVSTRMTSDAERFLVTTTLDAYDDGTRVFARQYTHELPRDGV